VEKRRAELVEPPDDPVQEVADDRLAGCVAGQLVQVPLEHGRGAFPHGEFLDAGKL
jgi:hypothetical protein